jgi:type IV secretion system protein VirB4
MLFLPEFRPKARGLPDLLGYAALIDEGILLQKDGSFVSGLTFEGPDLESASADELNALSWQINASLKSLGTGWMVQVDALRIPALDYPAFEDCHFPHPVLALIDAERAHHYQSEGRHYETRQAMIFTYIPPEQNAAKLSYAFTEGGRAGKQSYADKSLLDFRRGVESVTETLGNHLRVKTMTSDDLLTHIHRCLTGSRQRVKTPPVPMYLDAVLGGYDFIGGLAPEIDNHAIRCITPMQYAPLSYPAMMAWLMHAPAAVRFSTRFICQDPTDADKTLTEYRKNWMTKRLGLGALAKDALNMGGTTFQNSDAAMMALDADAAITENNSGEMRFGYVTHTVVVIEEDVERADEIAKAIKKEFANQGFVASIETLNAVEAYLGSLPGNSFANVRRPMMSTRNLADMLPLSTLWAGPNEHPSDKYEGAPALLYADSADSTPFRLVHHVGDVGHTLVLGPTGSGKSTLLATMVAQHFRYKGARAFVFDKGYSMWALAQACGAGHYDLLGDGADEALQPLAAIDKESERVWAAQWIESIFQANNVQVTPEQRNRISSALDSLALADREFRTLTALASSIQDNSLRDVLEQYTIGHSALGQLLDSDHETLTSDHFAVFELEHLMEMPPRVAIPALLYLFHVVERGLDGSPTMLVLDEAWLMLDNPLFSAKIKEWLKVLRKRNASVIFATQSLADVEGSAIASVLRESCMVKLFLPNATARRSLALYQNMGLTERQVSLIASSIPKRDYYYHTDAQGKRHFSLALGPIALSFVAAADDKTRARIRELAQTHGNSWPKAWLEERGQTDAAQYL